MDAKWLDDFLAVAQCQSFTRAARLRSTSQSGLSRRIQSLEQWAGAPLVDRDAHPFGLTEAGKRFVPMARHLSGVLASARQLCATPVAEAPAPVRLVVAEGVECGVLPALLSRVSECGVPVSVRVGVKPGDAAREALLSAEADLWLAPQHERLPLPLDPLAFETVSVASDRLSPVVGVDADGRPLHMLPGTRDKPAPLLDHGAAGGFAPLIGMLMSAVAQQAHLHSVCAADSLHSLRAMVRQGLGVAFLPESMVRDELRRGELARADMRWSAALDVRLVRALRPAVPAGDAARSFWRRLAARDELHPLVPRARRSDTAMAG